MNRELRNLYLILNAGGFWEVIFPPVDVVLDDALAALRCTPCAELRGLIVSQLFAIADNSPSHEERVQALARLFDYFHTPETSTNVH